MTTLHLRKSIGWSPLRLGVLLIAFALVTLAKRMAFPLLLLTAGLVFVQPCKGQSGTWAPTGNLNIARGSHTATLLLDGRVLVAGGYGFSGILASAELYDPGTGTWSPTGDLHTARYYHTATLLPNGMVLVAGGSGAGNNDLASAELYDPGTGTWSPTGSLHTARFDHTATLSNGMVLVAGGGNALTGLALATAELYDPALERWSFTGPLSLARYEHTATLLSTGKVLAAGGAGNVVGVPRTAELYDPETGIWSSTNDLNTEHYRHTATLLANGMALVAGGLHSTLGILAIAELYNPANGAWSTTGPLNTARFDHTATLLPNNMVLVAGGHIVTGYSNSAELYNPETEAWSTTGSLNTARYQHTATLLSTGKVLVAGGNFQSGYSGSAELYAPNGSVQVTVQTNPAGLTFTVDGITYSMTQTFSWVPGSSHTIATTSPQSGVAGVQYVWTNWTGGGAISHTVAPTTNKTYTANFNTQYFLTMSHGTGGTVTPASAWKNSGTVVSIHATPASGHSFTTWSGSGTGSYSGTNNPASITMNGPITENGSFTQNNVQVIVQTNLAGLSFSVDGTTYSSTQTFSWVPGSSHTIATTSPQNGATGVRYTWTSWTGGGAISHTVAPTTNKTYTANFNTQYFLTMSHGTGGTVTPASAWKNSGTVVSIHATPASGHSFTTWSGSGTGSYSGTNNPASVTMGGPITEMATFSP